MRAFTDPVAKVAKGVGYALLFCLLLLAPGRGIWGAVAAYEVEFHGEQGVGTVSYVSWLPINPTAGGGSVCDTTVKFRGRERSFQNPKPLGKLNDKINVRYARNYDHIFVPSNERHGYWYAFGVLGTLNGSPAAGEVLSHALFFFLVLGSAAIAGLKFVVEKILEPLGHAFSWFGARLAQLATRIQFHAWLGKIRNLAFQAALLGALMLCVVKVFETTVRLTLKVDPLAAAMPLGVGLYVGFCLLVLTTLFVASIRKDMLFPKLQEALSDLVLILSLWAVLQVGWQQLRTGNVQLGGYLLTLLRGAFWQ